MREVRVYPDLEVGLKSDALPAGWQHEPRLLEQVRNKLRAKHYSGRTEKSYLYWIRRYIHDTGFRHPRDLGATELGGFISLLATRHRISPSTQS